MSGYINKYPTIMGNIIRIEEEAKKKTKLTIPEEDYSLDIENTEEV